MSSLSPLDAQAAARKERLAQLKSLKRKQLTAETSDSNDGPSTTRMEDITATGQKSPSPVKDTNIHLSGRNYDFEARAPKMGFVSAPNEGQETLEDAANAIIERTKTLQKEDEQNDKPIDLFSLQPKKPNWDLKRDVDKKLERLNARTDSAIAKMIRKRIEESRQKKFKENGEVDGEEVGVEGNLAAMVQEREKENTREEGEEDEDMAE
ncbi:hypothetical protein RUND412_011076 [Rhizina undulata]